MGLRHGARNCEPCWLGSVRVLGQAGGIVGSIKSLRSHVELPPPTTVTYCVEREITRRRLREHGMQIERARARA